MTNRKSAILKGIRPKNLVISNDKKDGHSSCNCIEYIFRFLHGHALMHKNTKKIKKKTQKRCAVVYVLNLDHLPFPLPIPAPSPIKKKYSLN